MEAESAAFPNSVYDKSKRILNKCPSELSLVIAANGVCTSLDDLRIFLLNYWKIGYLQRKMLNDENVPLLVNTGCKCLN